MSEGLNPEQQLSEVQGIIAESRSQFSGGGIVAVVFGLLTAAAFAVMAMGLVQNTLVVWAVHNCLGWGFTLVWFQRESKIEGRVSQRGISVLRLWAAVNLAVWLCVWSLGPIAQCAVVPVLLGLGVVGTGLISESTFSQCMGVLLMASGPVIVAFASGSLAWYLVGGALVGIGIIWGAGTWLVKERR